MRRVADPTESDPSSPPFTVLPPMSPASPCAGRRGAWRSLPGPSLPDRQDSPRPIEHEMHSAVRRVAVRRPCGEAHRSSPVRRRTAAASGCQSRARGKHRGWSSRCTGRCPRQVPPGRAAATALTRGRGRCCPQTQARLRGVAGGRHCGCSLWLARYARTQFNIRYTSARKRFKRASVSS